MIESATLDRIAAEALALGATEATVQRLREQWPALHFSYCMDDDVSSSAVPVRELPGMNLYLVDGREHCLCLTGNAEVATGLVLAEVDDDDV